ncbi:hypothetical protein [Sphingomonas sp.]|uniref:hypothetical protein n=1 Tax=Sphingomonas sp. TaxID=28214 RepID=UPI003B007D60
MRSAIRRLGIPLALLTAAAVVGCGSGPDLVKAPNTAADDPLAAAAYPNIVLHDGLEQALVKEKPVVHPAVGDDPMTVRVPLRSVIDEPLSIQWQVTFATADGEQLTDNPVWHPEVILPRTRKYIEASSITRRATRYELQVRLDR